MIIGKRQIILSALVLGLGIAVYLNWQYSSMSGELPVTAAPEENGDIPDYGEAQYVDSPQMLDNSIIMAGEEDLAEPDGNEAFFVEAKLSRQKARDEAADTLAVMLSDVELDSNQKTTLALRAADLADSIETEGKIENLIKAKGFTDVMVYYDTERADIMIKTAGLISDDVVKIKDIILKETEIPVENISIIEVS
jgi:stage III sporulation protein AH